MEIISSFIETLNILFMAFLLHPFYKKEKKIFLYLSFFLLFIIRLFFSSFDFISFLLTGIFVITFKIFLLNQTFLLSIICTGLLFSILFTVRSVVAAWNILFRGEHVFYGVSNGFSYPLMSIAVMLISIFVIVVYKKVYNSLKKNYPSISDHRIYIALMDYSIIIFSIYIFNRLLRYLIIHSKEISQIDSMNTLFFIVILIWVGLTIITLYFVNSSWLSNEVFTLIKTAADQDPMTGVYNRRSGLKRLLDIYKISKFRKQNFVLCFVDVNNLKVVNDRYGHAEGDRLILTVAQTMGAVLRSNDFIIRYGGDEFIIVFQNCSMIDSQNAWNRIVSELENINFSNNIKYRINASAGFASFSENPTLNLNELIDLADSQMYKNKRIYKNETR